jgi:hypothetical protein
VIQFELLLKTVNNKVFRSVGILRIIMEQDTEHELQRTPSLGRFDISILPNIGEQEVYSQCLFKTISFHELKKELKKKNVSFPPSDSYYILTLKMRAKILEEAGAEPNLLKETEDEIGSNNKSKQKRKAYNCCLTGCTFKTVNWRSCSLRQTLESSSFQHQKQDDL